MTTPAKGATAYFATRLKEDDRRRKLWSHLTRYLARYVRNDASVLELGAGYCYFINAVPASRKTAVDLTEDVRRWAAAGVEAVAANALDYCRTAPDAQFDFIFASNFLEHFDWPELNAMIADIRRILRPGGRFCVIQPNFRLAADRYFDDYTHRAIFTDVSIADWLEANGLKVVKVEARFLPLTVKSRMGGMTFLVPLYLRLPWRPLAGQMFALAEKT